MDGDYLAHNQYYRKGWIVGWLQSGEFTFPSGKPSLRWLWWTGTAWGSIDQSQQFPWRADADAVAVGLQLQAGAGEIRVQ